MKNDIKEDKETLKKESIAILKPIFEKYNSMDNRHTITKEEVLAETEDREKEKHFKRLIRYNIVKKSKGKYYFEKANESNTKAKKSKTLIASIIVLIIIVIAIITAKIVANSKSKISIDDGIVNFSVTSTWTQIEDYPYGWYFYKFISNTPNEDYLESGSTETFDYADVPASIQIIYEDSEEESDDIEEIKETFKEYLEEQIAPDIYSLETDKTEKGYDILKTRIEFYEEPQEIDYIYYIFYNGQVAEITATTFQSKDEKTMKAEIDKIADNFTWK